MRQAQRRGHQKGENPSPSPQRPPLECGYCGDAGPAPVSQGAEMLLHRQHRYSPHILLALADWIRHETQARGAYASEALALAHILAWHWRRELSDSQQEVSAHPGRDVRRRAFRDLFSVMRLDLEAEAQGLVVGAFDAAAGGVLDRHLAHLRHRLLHGWNEHMGACSHGARAHHCDRPRRSTPPYKSHRLHREQAQKRAGVGDTFCFRHHLPLGWRGGALGRDSETWRHPIAGVLCAGSGPL
mmetsp:Transcript_76943/g.213812  ORF Transcript_76943/g.213812 Transcript_76943/m.213812 type:complete len:242 (-) Transcript_76943:272-997(-)